MNESRTVWVTNSHHMHNVIFLHTSHINASRMDGPWTVWVQHDLHPGSHHMHVNEAYCICMSHKWTSHELRPASRQPSCACEWGISHMYESQMNESRTHTKERVTNCDLHPGSHHVRVNEAYHICIKTQSYVLHARRCVTSHMNDSHGWYPIWMRLSYHTWNKCHITYKRAIIGMHTWKCVTSYMNDAHSMCHVVYEWS